MAIPWRANWPVKYLKGCDAAARLIQAKVKGGQSQKAVLSSVKLLRKIIAAARREGAAYRRIELLIAKNKRKSSNKS